MSVQRLDRYLILVDGIAVRATDEQEQRIRAMTDDERARFVKIMGGDRGD